MLCKGYPKTYAMVMQVLQDACPLDEFFQQFPDTKRVMKIFAIAVNPMYRRKGIAESLLYQSITVAQKNRIDSAVITATNPDMGKISSKLQMKKFKSVYWKNYKDDFGEKWFPKSMDQFIVEGYYKSVFGEIE